MFGTDTNIEPATAARPSPTIRFTSAQSWLGAVLVAATEKGVCAILFDDDPARLGRRLAARFPEARLIEAGAALAPLAAKVVAALDDPGQAVDLPLDPHGSAFERRVWDALRDIPAGATATYSEIAARIGAPGEAKAVGAACAANMIAVAIPCHRVVRKDGTLAGYRWGVARKRALLAREGAR